MDVVEESSWNGGGEDGRKGGEDGREGGREGGHEGGRQRGRVTVVSTCSGRVLESRAHETKSLNIRDYV